MTAFAIPGDVTTPTGGYVYDRRVMEASGGALTLSVLPGGFPFPSDAELADTASILNALDGPALIDGLAYGALPADLIAALPHAPIALCHHPLGMEAGLDKATAARLIAKERAALALARHAIVTSDATKATLVENFGLPDDKITVAAPGLDRAAPARIHRTPHAGPPLILTVASLTPRKAHEVLIRALADVADQEWRAVWAGPDDRAPDWAANIRAEVEAAGLGDRIELIGACEAAVLDRLYDEAALFCLPSRYEGYGMVFTEAMMRGLPIIAAETDAAREVIPANAALIARNGDAASLAGALRAALGDPDEARKMGAAGRAHALTLPGWDETWGAIRAVLEGTT